MTDEKPNGEFMKEKDISCFLHDYAKSNPARFHMPGHKGGLGFEQNDWKLAATQDITEIPGADNLLQPEDLLLRAQLDVAQMFDVQHSFFLTCGATSGILAMLLSLPGRKTILASRDCHKSFISALALSGHDVVFASILYDSIQNRFGVLGLKEIKEAYNQHPEISVVYLTRPDYWGRCSDIEAIAAFCKQNDLLLIVDEAHGAHFVFSNSLPKSACHYADLIVHSAHKTLAAWNQAAYLHIGKYAKVNAPSVNALARALKLVHTTSPSYLILASLESAPSHSFDQDSWNVHLKRLESWISSLSKDWQSCLHIVENDLNVHQKDPSRLVIAVSNLNTSGYLLASHLQKSDIIIEMSDAQHVVLITTPDDPYEWYERLSNALSSFQPIRTCKNMPQLLSLITLPIRTMSIREATTGDCEIISLEASIGRICAQSFGFYPPGHAILTPGEVINQDIVELIRSMQNQGARTFGYPLLCVK